jgi:uncharacterized protein (DUF1810 family)
MAFDLDRFVQAQVGTYDGALRELRDGQKTGHWIWFIFPQVHGLGRSEAATYYALESLDEARAYLAHPVLGPRLRACASALLAVPDRTAAQILGGLDALKVRSSMTLFQHADPNEPLFRQVLERFYDGVEDELTVARLD